MFSLKAGLLILFCCFGSAAAAPRNILLIIADDYGVDSSSLYNSTNTGAQLPPTPNIALLAKNGVVFRNAYAYPVCSPTRSCILTGQFGFRTGIGDVIDNGPSLTTAAFTLPRAFNTNASLGYHLAQFGKWHLANGPNSPRNVGGWTNFAGSLQGAIANYTNWTKTVNGSQTLNYASYATTDLVNDAAAWIQARGTNPWFVWAAFNAPHSPLHLPPTNLCPHYAGLPGTQSDINARPSLYYDAMVEALDTEIGRLLTYVNQTNTHIIFLGDNGTPSNVLQPPFPAGRGKDTLYQGGTHVPLVVSGPAIASPGRTNDTLVNMVDIFATILDLAGINIGATTPTNVVIDGQSIVPVLQGTNTLARYAYSEEFGTNVAAVAGGHCLRNSQYKLIQFNDHRQEFYDIGSDAYEGTNLLLGSLSSVQQSNYYGLTLQLAGYQTALAQPKISGVLHSNSQMIVTVQRDTNLSYTLWRSYAFDDLAWAPAPGAVAVTNGASTVTLTDTNAAADHFFYRVVGSFQ